MKYLSLAVVLLVAFLGFAYVLIDVSDNSTLGAAEGAYQYKHYTSTSASSTAGTVVRGGRGELGTVTINTTSAQIVKLYDGATTATSGLNVIAAIKASAAEQTFTYDVALEKGLVVELPASYAGDITIGVR